MSDSASYQVTVIGSGAGGKAAANRSQGPNSLRRQDGTSLPGLEMRVVLPYRIGRPALTILQYEFPDPHRATLGQ